MHRHRLNLNRSTPQFDAVAEARTSAPAVPVPAQGQLHVQPEPRRANSVQSKAPEALAFHREPSKNAGTTPFNFNRLTKVERREGTQLRIPDSVRQAQLGRQTPTMQSQLGRRTPIMQSGPTKRPPQLPPREHIEQQPPKKRKLDQVQQPPDPGPSRPPDHIPAPTSSGNPNAHPPSTPTHPIRECNTTGTPSPQKPQLPSRMGLLRTPNKGSSCSPNVPIEQQAQVSKPEQQSPHPPPSVSQPTPDYELTKEELDELGAKPEPQRYNEWMKAMFVYKAEGEIKQTAFWNLYQNTFTPFIKTRPLLDALDGISSIPEVFPQARIMVSEGHPQRYVIQGLDRRKASATKKTHRCEWDRGRCPTQAFASDTDFSDHVLAHLASADSNNWSCLWASCPQPPLPKQALTLHVFGAHLPSMQFSQKHPIQGDVIASPSKNGPSPTEPLSTCLPSQSGPELQQQQVPPPSQPEPRTDALVENLLQTIITRLERMEDAACERYAKLDERLGIMQSAIEVDRKQKQKAEEKERRKAEDEERQKAEAKARQRAEAEEKHKAEDAKRQKAETETQNLADGQNKIMRYLALLAQPVGEMKRATAETREVLGIVDATAAPVGQVDRGIDVQVFPDGALGIDILDLNESVSPSAVGSASTPKPGLRGWQPQSEEPCENIVQPDLEPRSRGRSVIERLESMEKMQRTMAAWCEKMKDREAALRLESQNVDRERRRSEVAAETVLPPTSEVPPARVAVMTSPSPVPVTHPIPTQLQTRSLSTLSSNASTATRDSIDIHLSDPPPISSTSTSTLYSAADDPGASTITSTKTGHPTISVHDENGAEGPLVRIHATGSARVRLLELVKTLVSGENVEKQKEVLSKDAIVQCVAEDAVAEEGEETIAMDVDVFGSRPNFDPRQKSKRKNHMEKTLVDDTSAIVLQDTAICGSGSTPTHPTSTDALSSDSIQLSKDATAMPLHTTPQKHTPSASGSTLANEGGPPASLKIKIKPIQYRAVNVTTPTRIGSSMMSEPAGAFTAASPIAHPDIPTASASDPQSGPHPSSKSRSPITTGFGMGLKFGFSPVRDWTHSSPISKSLSSDFGQGPISSTPTHSGRRLRSSSRPQAGTSTPLDGRASIDPRTPTRTPRTHSLLAEPRKAKAEEVVHSQEANISPVTNLAERAIQGLLDSQAVTPQRPYSLDPGVAGPGPLTPNANASANPSASSSLVIRLPPSASKAKNILQSPLRPSRSTLKEEELDDEPAEQIAARAVKGLLHAQAMSPQKPYSVNLDMTGSAQKSTVVLMDPPVSPPRRPETPTTSPFLSRSYTLPSPLEGTVAALRQQALGHPYVYAGAGLGSSKMDSRATKQEELDTTGFQADRDVVGQTLDDTVETENGQGEKSVSVEATPIQADQSMEDLTINESQPTNEDRAGHDDPMTSKQVSMEVQISSDSQKALPSTPTAASPLPPLEVLEKSAEPDPEYGAEFTDSPPLLATGPEQTFHRTLTPPPDFRPQPQLSPQHDLQLSPILPATDCPPPVSPAIEMLELLTSENAPSISYTIRTTSTEPKDTIPPSLASTYVLSTDTAVALPISQTTTTTVDEQQVDSLLMDDIVSSSPVKHSAAEPDRQEPPNDLEPDLSFIQAQDTTPRCSPIIPSSCSPPELWPDGFEMDDVLDKSGAVTEHVEPIHAGEAAIERVLSPLVKDSDKQQPPQHDENVIRTPSPVSPRIHSASPNVEPISAVDEDTLRPEVILQVKTELGALPDRLVTQKQTSSAGHGRSLTTEPEFIYISDSSPQKPPVKKTVVANQGQKKRIQRALSIISISSDDEDVDNRPKVNPPQSDTENGINKPSEIRVLKVERFGDPFHTNPVPRTPIAAEVEAEEQLSLEQSTIVATQPNPTPNEALPAASILTKELSPMSDLSNETPPPEHNAEKGLNNVGNSSFDFKKYSAKLDADDDVPIIPLKKRRKVSGISEAATEDGSVADSENGTVAVKKKSLLVLAKKGRSAAVTRVKKRKNLDQEVDSDEEEQPPLKKANLRKDIKASESTGTKQELLPKAKEKGKARGQPARSPKKTKVELPKTPMRFPRGQQKVRTVKWPTIQKPDYDQFIKCDLCDNWYHLGCVGVGPNDPSMDDAELYTCPPCATGVLLKESESPHKVQPDFDKLESNSCSRPKCQRPKAKKKKVLPEEQTFVIESFVGRHRKVVGGKGTSVYYLVKWQGYPYKECTWEELIAMNLSNSSVLEQTFERAAQDEELDLDNSSDEYLLLKEAVDAGWGSNGLFVNPE